MTLASSEPTPFWAVARTILHHDRLAAENVARAGYEVFAPKIKTRVSARWRVAPLFPGYLFVRVVEQWRIIERTIGVLTLVKFGNTPARCPDAEVAKLLARSDDGGIMALPPAPTIALGTRVRVIDGPFRGFEGLYAGMIARDRERILIDLLGRQTAVELGAGQLVETA
jgi:transcriptional antiterminator RfaH